ncbi:hypothetical protein PIB30_068686 [Stylosanthes scabra]|uniref:Uncharacterized protein n=1 Tax=Stylosanthes scabra TaxID=79078 RepID=A0ABU6YKK3_9FABA|nr:hypothetical protein [Stylosanthes scabra]
MQPFMIASKTDAKVRGSSPTLQDPRRNCGKFPRGWVVWVASVLPRHLLVGNHAWNLFRVAGGCGKTTDAKSHLGAYKATPRCDPKGNMPSLGVAPSGATHPGGAKVTPRHDNYLVKVTPRRDMKLQAPCKQTLEHKKAWHNKHQPTPRRGTN